MAWRDEVLDTLALLSEEIEAHGRVDLSSKLDSALGMLGGLNLPMSAVSFDDIYKFFEEHHADRAEAAANAEAFEWILQAELQNQVGFMHTILDDIISDKESSTISKLSKIQALAVIMEK